MSTQFVGDESIVILNDNFQYEPNNQVENAKWLDIQNVMSVKRDKTIYAVRARNNFDFAQGRNNSSFFANTNMSSTYATFNGDYNEGVFFTSNMYRGFNTRLDGTSNNIFMTAPANVYGNLSANADISNSLMSLGIGGSLLDTNFEYINRISGNINIQSNVRLMGNISDADMSAWLPRSLLVNPIGNTTTEQAASGSLYANVDGNTAYNKLFYNDDTRTQWNRLINANLRGNVMVTASCDPCDQFGDANPLSIGLNGNAFTNEAYRHQFQLKKNSRALAKQNPIYIARVSRFGKSLSDNQNGNIVSRVSMHSFTGNFAASIPGDNSLYAGANIISNISITGNISMPSVVVINSNFRSGNLVNPEGFNGVATNNLPALDNNSRFINITDNLGSSVADYVTGGPTFDYTNGNLKDTARFAVGDRVGFVQANVALEKGYMLLDRIAFRTSDPTFIRSSRVFSGNNTQSEPESFFSQTLDRQSLRDNYTDLWFQSNMFTNTLTPEISSKYLVIKGTNVIGNNWQTVSLMTPESVVMPAVTGNPNLEYLQPGNLVNLYLRRGQLSMDNYTYVNNKTLTGVRYLSSVPSFVQNVSLPLNNIVFSENIFVSMVSSENMKPLNLPLIPGATRTLQSNVTNNYNFVFSGNANVDQRVNLRSNVVCPVNFANSFIANCWNYGTNGQDLSNDANFTADIQSNVSLIYGNFPVSITVDNVTRQVQTLSLNSEMSKYNIEYDVDFVRSTGSTNASSYLTQTNYVFYANVDATGNRPNVSYSRNSQVSTSVLNENENINGMHLPGVAYSEYSFSDQSFKFTDLGNVLGSIDPGVNSNVITLLPSAVTNTNDGSSPRVNLSNQDSFLNIITDYLNFQNLSGDSTDIHHVTCSNFAYRYSISGVTSPGESNFNNSIMVGAQIFNPDTLYSNPGIIGPTVSGSVRASVVSCYVYENVDNTTAPEQLYPFVIPDSDNSLPTNSTVSNLFPGFEWRAISGGFSYFQQKTSSTVNFVLPNNGLTSQNFALTINSHNTDDGTMKVGLSFGSTVINPRTIRIVPIQHGRDTNDAPLFATPIVCGVQNEPNTYVIIMVECRSSSANGASGGLASSISNNFPTTVNISTIEQTSTGLNQVSCQAYLRVFDDNNNRRTDIEDNYSFRAPLSIFNFAPSGNGNNLSTSLSLNIFSAPPNNAIISIIYKQEVINKVLSFSRTDYLLNDRFTGYVAVPVNPSAVNFASSLSNSTLNFAPDSNRPSNPRINPLSTRYYIEGTRSGIWIDVRNDAVVPTSQMGVLRVDRSVEWRLTRSWNNNTEQVGRGLLSKNSVNAATTTNNYLIFENLPGFAGSGYAHSIRANLNDLCTRLLLQSLQTNANIINNTQNRNNWLINSLSDQINIMLVRMDPVTNLPISLTPDRIRDITLSRSGDSIDLGALFVLNPLLRSQYAGTLGVISLSSIRGFGVNLNAQAGSVDIPSSMFSYNIRPDCYSLVHINRRAQFGGDVLSQFNVLFTEQNNVTSTNDNTTLDSVQMTLTLGSASLAYQYLDVTSPQLSNSFVQIGTYTHNGYGQIQYYIKDFVSNYDTDLPSELIVDGDEGLNLNPFGNSALNSFQVDNVLDTETPTRVVNIRYDPAEAGNLGKFYFNLDENVRPLNPSDRVYFRGIGLDSLPTQINNHTTLLLYTGLRPLVLNVLQVAQSETTLDDLIGDASIFNWDPIELDDNIFTNLERNTVTTFLSPNDYVNRQFYQVVLTNLSAANNNQSIRFRANRYAPTSAWLNRFDLSSNPNRNFFGTYVNASKLLNSLRLNILRESNINTVFSLSSEMRTPLENPQKSDDDIISGAIRNRPFTASTDNLLINSGSAAFTISGDDEKNSDHLGELFTISIQGVLNSYEAGDGAGFRITINPSTLTLYTALDTNNNGEIDTTVNYNINDTVNGISTYFTLNSMFSELNFNLPFGPTQFLKPSVVSTTVLNRQFISVPGAPFDILLNNMWAVGHNLDCFFTIRNNIAAEFDVICIGTRANTNPDGSQVTNLLVDAYTAPLVIANPNEWARSLIEGDGVDTWNQPENAAGNWGRPSGLTFKLINNTQNVVAGEVVRLYVDNTIANNTLEWNVSVAGNTAKTYQLYSYDQTRYAALLDQQLAITNKFVNEN